MRKFGFYVDASQAIQVRGYMLLFNGNYDDDTTQVFRLSQINSTRPTRIEFSSLELLKRLFSLANYDNQRIYLTGGVLSCGSLSTRVDYFEIIS